MALEVREEVSAVMFYKNVNGIDAQEAAAPALAFQPISSAMSPDSIMADIEGIHSIITRNFTYYTPNCLKQSAPLWTTPYERPVIMHHKDKDGIQIGRVKVAEYKENTRANAPGLLFSVNIGDEAGVKGVENGTLSTVSIGAVVHKATCSICGQDIVADGECEHQRGHKYDGKLCYWLMEEMEPKELSYVIVPSDRYANTVRIYKPKKLNSKESYNEGGNENSMGIFDNLDLTMKQPESKEATQPEVPESTQVTEGAEPEVKEPEVPVAPEVQTEPENKEPEVQAEPEAQEPEVQAEPEQQKEEGEKIEDLSKEELIDRCIAMTKQINGLMDDVKYLKSKLDKERGFKESLELEILKLKQKEKMHLAEQVCELRKELGLKEEAMEDLMLVSEESLNSSIKTLNEFKESNTFNFKKLPSINSSALIDNDSDNTIKESAESDLNKNNSNINYDQQLNDWFKNMTNRRFK